MNISKKDIEIFGRVLKEIGESITNDPEKILALINSKKNSDKQLDRGKEIEGTNFYELSKNKNDVELVDYFKSYDIKELKYIIKILKFGYNRSKSKETLLQYIIDQIKKRTTDVFREHNVKK